MYRLQNTEYFTSDILPGFHANERLFVNHSSLVELCHNKCTDLDSFRFIIQLSAQRDGSHSLVGLLSDLLQPPLLLYLQHFLVLHLPRGSEIQQDLSNIKKSDKISPYLNQNVIKFRRKSEVSSFCRKMCSPAPPKLSHDLRTFLNNRVFGDSSSVMIEKNGNDNQT